jgi:hypothetical protein
LVDFGMVLRYLVLLALCLCLFAVCSLLPSHVFVVVKGVGEKDKCE